MSFEGKSSIFPVDYRVTGSTMIDTMWHSLRSNTIVGISGLVCSPYRVTLRTTNDAWHLAPLSSEEYVFCHNDLSQANICSLSSSITTFFPLVSELCHAHPKHNFRENVIVFERTILQSTLGTGMDVFSMYAIESASFLSLYFTARGTTSSPD